MNTALQPAVCIVYIYTHLYIYLYTYDNTAPALFIYYIIIPGVYRYIVRVYTFLLCVCALEGQSRWTERDVSYRYTHRLYMYKIY